MRPPHPRLPRPVPLVRRGTSPVAYLLDARVGGAARPAPVGRVVPLLVQLLVEVEELLADAVVAVGVHLAQHRALEAQPAHDPLELLALEGAQPERPAERVRRVHAAVTQDVCTNQHARVRSPRMSAPISTHACTVTQDVCTNQHARVRSPRISAPISTHAYSHPVTTKIVSIVVSAYITGSGEKND